MNIRPATRRDFKEFFADDLPRPRARAWVAEVDGKVLGIGGYYFAGENAVAFSNYKPGLTKKQKVLGARKLVEILKGTRLPIIAMEDDQNGTNAMKHFGFEDYGLFWRLQ